MIITDDKKLKDIQVEFSKNFPHLKIEFYARRHAPGEGSPLAAQLNAEKTVGEIRSVHSEGDLSINGLQQVRTLEQHLLEKYGLNAQVFRKSGNLWLQTSATDHWTLTEQNLKGGSSEVHFNEKYHS